MTSCHFQCLKHLETTQQQKIMQNRRFSKRADGLLGMVVTQVLCHSFIEIWCLKSWQNTSQPKARKGPTFRGLKTSPGILAFPLASVEFNGKSLWNRWESLCIILGYFRHLCQSTWNIELFYTPHVILHIEMIYLNCYTSSTWVTNSAKPSGRF